MTFHGEVNIAFVTSATKVMFSQELLCLLVNMISQKVWSICSNFIQGLRSNWL